MSPFNLLKTTIEPIKLKLYYDLWNFVATEFIKAEKLSNLFFRDTKKIQRFNTRSVYSRMLTPFQPIYEYEKRNLKKREEKNHTECCLPFFSCRC